MAADVVVIGAEAAGTMAALTSARSGAMSSCRRNPASLAEQPPFP